MADSTVNVLSLCSGAGGLDRGVRMEIPTARTVCYVEIEAYAAEVLACRMEEGRLDAAPLWSNLQTFDGRPWRGAVDLVVGGYPCQPFSVAGARRGADDPRHLWPHIARILRELGKPNSFFENVSGHVSIGLREVRCELESMGYRVEAEIVRAEEVGAPHRRERVFILAYTDSLKLWDQPRRSSGKVWATASVLADNREQMADTTRKRWREGRSESSGVEGRPNATERRSAMGDADSQGQRQYRREFADVGGWARGTGQTPWPPRPDDWCAWQDWNGPKPAVRGNVDGLAGRMGTRIDELRLCGGGVVPAQAAYALQLLRERISR